MGGPFQRWPGGGTGGSWMSLDFAHSGCRPRGWALAPGQGSWRVLFPLPARPKTEGGPDFVPFHASGVPPTGRGGVFGKGGALKTAWRSPVYRDRGPFQTSARWGAGPLGKRIALFPAD